MELIRWLVALVVFAVVVAFFMGAAQAIGPVPGLVGTVFVFGAFILAAKAAETAGSSKDKGNG